MSADNTPAVPDTAALAQRWATRSAELLADWQDYDSHDGHARRGEGIAYSDAAAELRAALRDGPAAEPTRTWDDAVAEIPAPLRADADVLVRWVTLHGGEPMHALSRLLRLLARDVPAGRDLTAQDVREELDDVGLTDEACVRVAAHLTRITRGDQR